ncbi:MAG: hypothetical protein KDD94_11335, partial [Calditrichaeota bacterium]|nr:hypothetical protein [Calditrichota bacterium]
TFLVDRSLSTEPYTYQIDSVIDQLEFMTNAQSIDYQRIEFNAGVNNRFTDIYSAINSVEKKSDEDKIFLISDGNQNAAYQEINFKTSVYSIPVGQDKITQLNARIGEVSLTKFQPLKTPVTVPIEVIHPPTGDDITVNVIQNDSIVFSKTIQPNSSSTILNPQLYFSSIGPAKVKINIKQGRYSDAKNREVIVQDQRVRIAYVFDQPNLECRFLLNQLSPNKFLVDYIPIELSKTIDHDLILASISQEQYKSRFTDILQAQIRPAIVFSQIDLNFNRFGFEIDLGDDLQSAELKENLKLPSVLSSFFLRNNLSAVSIIPDLQFRKLHIAGNTVRSYSLFAHPFEPVQLVQIKSVSRFLFSSTLNLWHLHMDMQNDLQGRNFYREFINYYVQLLLTGSANIIQMDLKQSQLQTSQVVNYTIRTSYPDGTNPEYDFLTVETRHDNKLISELNLPFQSSGVYSNALTVPDSGRIDISVSTRVQNESQFKRHFQFQIQQQKDELTDLGINRNFLTDISQSSDAELIERSEIKSRTDLFNVKQTERLKSSLIKLYFEPVLLILLLVLISAEYWLRKQNKLL